MYSLLMVGSRGWWDDGGTDFDLSRYLEYTEDRLKEQLGTMTPEVIERLKGWPVMFAYEFYGHDEPSVEVAYVGRFTSIKARKSKARIAFEFDSTVPVITASRIRPILWDLDIDKYEPTRTHWAVKDVDLYEVLRRKGILGGLPAQVRAPDLIVNSEAVERAIDDAEHLITKGRGAASALDRVHTALHGYLIQLCVEANLLSSSNNPPSMTALFKMIREQHPKFGYAGPRASEVGSALKASPSIIEALNTLRNNASVAHPNDTVVPEPEAMYLVNLARSVLHYLEMKRQA
jgi:Abortive infection C-terminus